MVEVPGGVLTGCCWRKIDLFQNRPAGEPLRQLYNIIVILQSYNLASPGHLERLNLFERRTL